MLTGSILSSEWDFLDFAGLHRVNGSRGGQNSTRYLVLSALSVSPNDTSYVRSVSLPDKYLWITLDRSV